MNTVYFKFGGKSYELYWRGGGQDRPIIRNISAVAFGTNGIEYKAVPSQYKCSALIIRRHYYPTESLILSNRHQWGCCYPFYESYLVNNNSITFTAVGMWIIVYRLLYLIRSVLSGELTENISRFLYSALFLFYQYSCFSAQYSMKFTVLSFLIE